MSFISWRWTGFQQCQSGRQGFLVIVWVPMVTKGKWKKRSPLILESLRNSRFMKNATNEWKIHSAIWRIHSWFGWLLICFQYLFVDVLPPSTLSIRIKFIDHESETYKFSKSSSLCELTTITPEIATYKWQIFLTHWQYNERMAYPWSHLQVSLRSCFFRLS